MEANGFLVELPLLAFQAVLLFARLGAAVMLLPGFGEQEGPGPIRLGLGLGLVVLLMPARVLNGLAVGGARKPGFSRGLS